MDVPLSQSRSEVSVIWWAIIFSWTLKLFSDWLHSTAINGLYVKLLTALLTIFPFLPPFAVLHFYEEWRILHTGKLSSVFDIAGLVVFFIRWATLFLVFSSFFSAPLSLWHTKVGFHNTITEGSLFSGLGINTTKTHNVHMCTLSRTSQHARVHTQTHTHIPGPVFWFPGCPIVPCYPLINGPLCICVCVCACVFECVDSSVSPPGLMSHPAFPPHWHSSALLITHRHLHSSGVLWQETRHTHLHTRRIFPFDSWIIRTIIAARAYPFWFVLLLSRWGLLPPDSPSSAAPLQPHKGAWEPRRDRDGFPIPLQAATGWAEGSQHQTPFSQLWMDLLIYIHTLSHGGDPNLTMPLWLCPAT